MPEQDRQTDRSNKEVVDTELSDTYDSLMEEVRKADMTLEKLQQVRINRARIADKLLEDVWFAKRRLRFGHRTTYI